jgi:hypothetical protein
MDTNGRKERMTMMSTIPRALRLIAAVTLVVMLALTSGATNTFANLTGSTFEGNDGNLAVTTAGNHDWVNAPNLTQATDTPSGQQDSSFSNGAKEDFTSPGVGDGSIPPNKNDLIKFYTANELAGGANFLYVAFTRSATNGNADIDFEINHQFTPSNATTGDPIVPLNRTDGDALFQFTYPGGGGAPGLEIWRWAATASSPFLTSAGCLNSSSFPATGCWSSPTQATAAQFQGASNSVAITNPLDSGNPLAVGTFGEAAINLQATGIFPAGSCSHFGAAWAKSRSADSGTSDLKDLIAPQPVNISNCGSITIHKVTQNGDGTFGFTTTGGLSPSTFNLSNGGTQAYSGTVAAGSYSVTEGTLPANWTLKNLACTPTGTGTSSSVSGATASITMAPNGNVDCTYTNFTKLSPTISTQLKDGANVNITAPVAIGAPVHDTSSLSGATSDAGGTVTYTVYTDTACTLGAQAAGTKTVTNGSVPDSNAISFTSAGTYYWQAAYSGDANNNSAKSLCTSEVVTVSPNSPSMSSAQNLLPNDSATLAGATANAAGSITLQLFNPSNSTCSGTPDFTQTVTVNGNGTYSTTNTTFHASTTGTWRWLVVYSGDANNNGQTVSCGTENFSITN